MNTATKMVNQFTEITARLMSNSGQGHYKMEDRGTGLDLAWYQDGDLFHLTVEVSKAGQSKSQDGQISAGDISGELKAFLLGAV